MNTLFLYDTKTMRGQINTKIFAGDNLITKINAQLPDNIGGYPKRECEYNLRAIIPEGNLSYIINPSQPYFYITNDITEKAQTVKLMMVITHEGNVIGRTNTVDLIVNEPAEAPDPPLTPREEFDEVIAEQRAEIAEQAETISTQGETITQQTERITELNGEVTELTTENTRLENQHNIDLETIDALSKRKEPIKLQAKVVQPETETQLVEADEGKDGLSSVTVLATGDRFIPRGQYDSEISQLNSEIDNQRTRINKLTNGISDIVNSQNLKQSDVYIYEDLFDGAFEIEGQFVDDVFYDSEDKIVVDADNKILIPPTAQAYHSSYTGSDIDAFVDGVAEIIRRIGGND